MSIENKLKAAFEQGASRMEPSAELGRQVLARADALLAERRVRRTRVKKHRFAAVVLAMLLVSGVAYASTMYTVKTSHVSMTMSGELELPASSLREIRAELDKVRQQLAPGESAYVYSAELDKRKLWPLTKVTQPAQLSSLAEWKLRTEPVYGVLKTPAYLPAGYAFVRGELDNAYQGLSVEESKKVLPGLKKQAKAGGAGFAWTKADASATAPFFPSPGIIVRNGSGKEIDIRYVVFQESEGGIRIQAKLDKQSRSEALPIGNQEGIFTKGANYLLSASESYAQLVWMEEADGRTVMYQVGSGDGSVGKEELLEVARLLQ